MRMYKRITVFALILTVLLSSLPFASFAASYSTGSYLVTSEGGVKLYDEAKKSLDFNITAKEDAYLNIIEVSGSFGYTVYDCVYGWVDLSSGLKYISSAPTVTGNTVTGAKGIEITSLPDKLSYIEGEKEIDLTGLDVSVIFDDENNSAMSITGYTVEFPSLATYGEKTVTVHYGSYTASFNISVAKVPVTGIVITLPKQTAYVVGEAISFDGLTVTAYFSDGRNDGKGIELEEGEYTISGVTEGDDTLEAGTYTVTVSYMYPEIQATFHIYVSNRKVTNLKLLKLPSDLTIYQGQSFNLNDFTLEATYDNGETATISEFDIEFDNMQVGTHTARIYYMDKYVAFDYEVLLLLETGIETGDTTSVGSYVTEEVDFSKLQVYVVYNSGEKKLLESYSYTLSHNIDTSTIGKYPVTVTYGGFKTTFEYTVSQRPERLLGDVDGNGKIAAADARMTLRAASMLENLDEISFSAADVDLNKKITAADARKILRVAAGIDSF